MMRTRLYALPGLAEAAREYEANICSRSDRGQRWKTANNVIRRLIQAGDKGIDITTDEREIMGGRLRDPVQNTPRVLRPFIGVRPGHVGISYDGVSMHAGLMGGLAKDSDFLRVLYKTKDGYPHLAEALLPGIRLPRKIAKSQVILPWINGSTPSQLLRRMKKLKHITPGEGGWRPDSGTPKLTRELVEEGDMAFQRRFHRLSEFREDTYHWSESFGFMRNRLPNGSRIEISRRAWKQAHTLLSAIFITLETRIIARAEKELGHPCLDMHDGFLNSVPEHLAEQEAQRGIEMLRKSAALDGFDIPVKVGIAHSWGVAETSAKVVDTSSSG